jgi:DNA-damage-inducible protein D
VHFADVRKVHKKKNQYKETLSQIDDIKLTRYACYLIAQNGDPRIPEIAFMQMYFAVQTRKQEVLEQNIEELERIISRKRLGETEKEFAKVAFERGVDGKGIAEIKNSGDKALFGGFSTKEMKTRLGIRPESKKALADVLPSVTLKAKDLATEMTTVNTKRKKLRGKDHIKLEHTQNNMGIRKALTNQDIYPEKLPAEEDIKVVEERYKDKAKSLEPKNKKLFD